MLYALINHIRRSKALISIPAATKNESIAHSYFRRASAWLCTHFMRPASLWHFRLQLSCDVCVLARCEKLSPAADHDCRCKFKFKKYCVVERRKDKKMLMWEPPRMR